jgi:hypothetical protein
MPEIDHVYRKNGQVLYQKIKRKNYSFLCEFFWHTKIIVITKKAYNMMLSRKYAHLEEETLKEIQFECLRCKEIFKPHNEKWPSSLKRSIFLDQKLRYHFSNLYTPQERIEINKNGFIVL